MRRPTLGTTPTKTTIVIVLISMLVGPTSAARKRRGAEETERPSAAQLQSMVMSFADRYSTGVDGALTDMRVEEIDTGLDPGKRLAISSSMVFSEVAAYTIAASPNPDVALMDLAALTRLNRLYLENYWQPKVGEAVRYLLENHVRLEEDIWAIVGRVLDPSQQQELRSMIDQWYREHPELYIINYLRFDDFAAERQESNLVQAVRSGGLLKPLKEAERELEETRMLAERGLYLGSRYPILAGSMVDVWLTAWATNPEIQTLLGDLHDFSSTADRLVTEVEQLPESVSVERQAAIEQFMGELAAERRRTFEDLGARETEFRSLLGEIRETVRMIEELLITGNGLAARLGFEPGEREEVESGIVTFQRSMVEVSRSAQDLAVVVDGMNELVNSPNWQAFMPAFYESLDKMEMEGKEIVDHTLRNGVLLLFAWLVLYIIGKLVVHFLLTRMLGERPASP